MFDDFDDNGCTPADISEFRRARDVADWQNEEAAFQRELEQERDLLDDPEMDLDDYLDNL